MKPSSGQLELLKWLALVLMTGDHVNTVLLDGKVTWLYQAGRVVFPLFCFVFAYNMTRPDQEAWGSVYRRVLRRLLLFGVIAAPFSMMAFDRPYGVPLNILFSFAGGLVLIGCVRRRDWKAVLLGLAVLLIGGSVVEAYWFGLLLIVAYWASFTHPGIASQCGVLLALLALCMLNGNLHALLTYPIIAIVLRVDVQVPRWRWLFYVYYPAHLAVLAAMRHL